MAKTNYSKSIKTMSFKEKVQIATNWRNLANKMLADMVNGTNPFAMVEVLYAEFEQLNPDGMLYKRLKRDIEQRQISYKELYRDIKQEAEKFEEAVLQSTIYRELNKVERG